MPDHDPELDAIVEELQRAGFVTIGTDAEGEETWTLTPTGEQIALQMSMSMSSEDDAVALLGATGRPALDPLTRAQRMGQGGQRGTYVEAQPRLLPGRPT